MIPFHLSSADSVQFRRFLDLPIELRLIIWRYLLPDGCYVQLRAPCHCTSCPSQRTWGVDRQWRLPNPSGLLGLGQTRRDKQPGPSTLRVCREARKETLQHYIALFEDDCTFTTVYFSPKWDILSLENCIGPFVKELHGFAPKLKEQLNIVKRISFGVGDSSRRNKRDGVVEFWFCFKGVEEVILNRYQHHPIDTVGIQKKLQRYRDRLAEWQNSPKCPKNAIKTIKVLTFDHVLHELQPTAAS
jgi:hypothetical protein